MNDYQESHNRYKVVSLFSGALGLDIGLENTDRFEVLACVEIEKSFCDTIRLNIDNACFSNRPIVIERDISKLSVSEFCEITGIRPGEIDVLVGGPPCQSFSIAGRRQSVQDSKGSLLWHYLRFIKGLRPKFFLMENVRGLLSAALRHRATADRPDRGGPPLVSEEQPGSVVRLFVEDLQKIDGISYYMDCFEVNAVNYGAPQLRERALFIGNCFNACVDFPAPTHGSLDNRKGLKPWNTLGNAIADLDSPGDIIMDFSPRKKQFLSLVPEGSNWRSLPEKVQRDSMGRAWFAKGGRSGWWRRLSFDLPCPTLLTMPNHSSTSLCHPAEVRALSLREYARIQEFPDYWQFCGTVLQQYAQVGNAVPIRLGQIAGAVISDALDKLAVRDWVPYKKRPESYRIINIQSHIRTRKWFRKGRTFIWKDGAKNTG